VDGGEKECEDFRSRSNPLTIASWVASAQHAGGARATHLPASRASDAGDARRRLV